MEREVEVEVLASLEEEREVEVEVDAARSVVSSRRLGAEVHCGAEGAGRLVVRARRLHLMMVVVTVAG